VFASLAEWTMQQAEILAIAGLRLDGRRFNELRRIKYKIGVENTADGSTYLEQGLNKVLVLIHGPKEMKNKGNEMNSEKVL
jgi:exosome complex component RRP41